MLVVKVVKFSTMTNTCGKVFKYYLSSPNDYHHKNRDGSAAPKNTFCYKWSSFQL